MNRSSLTIHLPAPAATKAAGAAFAEGLLAWCPPPALVALAGPLGAGKTTFAQGFGEAIGVPSGEVASPTFTLADLHRGAKGLLNHLDLYRLGGDGLPEDALKEFLEAGLDESLDRGYSLVEWPERLPPGYWPEDMFRVDIAMPEPAPATGSAFPDDRAPGLEAAGTRGRVLVVAGRFPLKGLRDLLAARGLKPPTA
ncbi:MAG: tRNA (adenosine(37)-N6)-threonylcarbamoyltransferase complex ATPase subunit type 1 TsaE [Deltaproteobacteria bacterium]|nr:tRNA (adenosine(37)-N6)-threonylcarbamoyltransferase complex ATPase subunit type 1 TsaE [Deltaproteobacteria bacterium]